MLLKNSIDSLKFEMDAILEKHGKEVLKHAFIKDNVENTRIQDPEEGFRWQMWWSLPQDTRRLIIAESLPFDSWVGGYAPHDDKHLMTLLKKVITEEYYR